jgi:hypothetical protein
LYYNHTYFNVGEINNLVPNLKLDEELYEKARFIVHKGDLSLDFNLNLKEIPFCLVVMGNLNISGKLISHREGCEYIPPLIYVTGDIEAETITLSSGLLTANNLLVKELFLSFNYEVFVEAESLSAPLAIVNTQLNIRNMTNVEFYFIDNHNSAVPLQNNLSQLRGFCSDFDWYSWDEKDSYAHIEFDDFLSNVVNTDHGIQNFIDLLHAQKKVDGISEVIQNQFQPRDLSTYWFSEIDDMNEPYEKEGLILRNELMSLALRFNSIDHDEIGLKHNLIKILKKYESDACIFGCSQIIDNNDVLSSIRPYVIAYLFLNHYDDGFDAIYCLLKIIHPEKHFIIKDQLGESTHALINFEFLQTFINYTDAFGAGLCSSRNAKMAAFLYECIYNRSILLDAADQLLQMPGWDLSTYEMMWNMFYSANSEDIRPIKRTQKEIEENIHRGLELASQMLLNHLKLNSTFDEPLKAARDFLFEFSHPAAQTWKLNRLTDELWLSQFDLECEGRNIKKILIEKFS